MAKASRQEATRVQSTRAAKTKASTTKVLKPLKSTTTPQNAKSSNKRKLIDLTQDSEDESASSTSSVKKRSVPVKKKNGAQEKRPARVRNEPPQTFLQKLARAQTQRMIVIGRSRHGQGQDIHEDIEIVGSTGNIYTVTIGRLPGCTCPDHLKGHECKHKVYALHTVLKARYELQYQRALLTSELEEIFQNAPPIPNNTIDKAGTNGKRKAVEGECPICYMELDPKDEAEIVWCKAACGNNVHRECFEQWAASQRGQAVKCVYCRTPWELETDDMEAIKNRGQMSGEGYVNVGQQFGLPGTRDMSSYHPYWVRRTYGYG